MTQVDSEEVNVEFTTSEQDIVDKILHILNVYPFISPSMLQMGVGPSLPATLWKPLLERLIGEGRVFRIFTNKETPRHRIQQYTVLTVHKEAYPIK